MLAGRRLNQTLVRQGLSELAISTPLTVSEPLSLSGESTSVSSYVVTCTYTHMCTHRNGGKGYS